MGGQACAETLNFFKGGGGWVDKHGGGGWGVDKHVLKHRWVDGSTGTC